MNQKDKDVRELMHQLIDLVCDLSEQPIKVSVSQIENSLKMSKEEKTELTNLLITAYWYYKEDVFDLDMGKKIMAVLCHKDFTDCMNPLLPTKNKESY